MQADTPGIGVIGCGVVSHAYLGTIVRSPAVRLKAVSSRTMVSAQAQARRYGCEAVSTDALLADPDITFVVNLAPPALHHAIGRQVLSAGKHLYSEKPFATTLEGAAGLVALARRNGLSIGCAPDTFLGDGHQLARRLIDEGAIGTIVAGAVTMASVGMEGWHPNPAAFYAHGGGPLLDVGPYYVTQLVNLLGPVVEVVAIGTRARDTREWRDGREIAVEIPTTVNGALLFESGANIALTVSWDVGSHTRLPIELYGDEGTMLAPDPNRFSGAVRVAAIGGDWISHGEEPSTRAPDDASLAAAMAQLARGVDPVSGLPLDANSPVISRDRRGPGLLDLVAAVSEGRAPRASGELALHVLEVLLALQRSALGVGRVAVRSRVGRPEPVEEKTHLEECQ